MVKFLFHIGIPIGSNPTLKSGRPFDQCFPHPTDESLDSLAIPPKRSVWHHLDPQNLTQGQRIVLIIHVEER